MTSSVNRQKLRTSFKNARSIAPLYTAGPVAVTPDGSAVITCLSDEILLTEISTGTKMCRFIGDKQPVSALCVSPSSKWLLVFTSSLFLRIFQLPESMIPLSKPIQPTRVVPRAHEAPIHVCTVDRTSTYLASGSADGVVKVWDIMRGYVTHAFKGHGGVVSALTFNYPHDSLSTAVSTKMQLITASVDTRIRIFNLSATSNSTTAAKPEFILEGHSSVPRGLDASPDGKWLVSGGRDSVVLIWDLLPPSQAVRTSKGKHLVTHPILTRTIPILERVEAVGLLQPGDKLHGPSSSADSIQFYTGGEKGLIKVWNMQDGKFISALGQEPPRTSDDQEARQILHLIYIPTTSTLASVHADQNIIFHSLSTSSPPRQLIGYNDEIVDATFLSSYPSPSPKIDSHLALATNSSLIRVYSTSSFDARLLDGHTDIVLSLDHGAGGRILASGSKDHSARIWAPLPGNDLDWGYRCVAICEGHAESIGAIALSRKAGTDATTMQSPFLFTGSQDRTIKMWDLSGVSTTSSADPQEISKCRSLTTHKAHEKDINALDVAPNDRLLVSGSQDRTAKIYEIDYTGPVGGRPARGELRLIGTCKGHKRGVWTVRFGRTERILATGSGDKTIKLWSLDDFSCLKTFEGHTNSVLRVDFINMGMQLVSAASDGLVKLWNIKEEECAATMDNHEDKVWALAVSNDEKTIVSAAADSVVTFWEDCTEEEELEKESKRAELVLKEQDFLNYLSLNDYRKAIQLALAMQQPGRILNLFKDITAKAEPNSITGDSSIDEVICTMAGSDLARLLRYVRDWNTHAKTSNIAQQILFAIVKTRSADDIMNAFKDEFGEATFMADDLSAKQAPGAGLKELVDALIPYTERHFSRMSKLVQDSYMVDYILSEMDDGMLDGEAEDDIMNIDVTTPIS
ncbi:U3 small nucleolar RNA-associated protein [Infundibulicybe gibba]|nr:U3 small nucleolar RNA-associated protein [Infundibulicybe gibba]